MHTRRKILGGSATAITMAIAGCSSGSSSSGDGGGDSGSTVETIVDDTDTIEEDQYLSYSFELNRSADVDIRATVRDGPRVDIFVTSPEEFSHFEEGERFRYNSELSQMDTAGYDASLEDMPEGEYVLVVDNTEMGEAAPPTNFDDDNARVEVELTAR